MTRKLMRGLTFAALIASLPGAPMARAEWLSLLRGSMLFDEGEFDPSVNYHGGCPSAVATADFDGDGHQDFVVANRNQTLNKPSLVGTSVSVLLHTNPSASYPGIGFWGPAATGPIPVLQGPTNFNVGTLPLNVGAGDFTGDGRPDIVVGGGVLTLLVNTGLPGSARFAPPKSYSMAGTFGSMHVGDVNGDGTLEIVVPWGGEAVRTYRGSGDSLILVGTSTVPTFRDPILVTDLTGDGYKDLVVYNILLDSDCDTNPWSRVWVIPGDSQGLFTGAVQGPFPSPIVNESAKSGLISASLNGDPYPEIIGVSGCEPKLWISPGLAGGQLAAPLSVTLPHMPTTVCAGDIDGDGDMDLVTTQYFTGNTPTSSVCVIRNNGNLTFATPTLSPGAARAWASVLSDVNEDGRLDLVTPQTGSYDWINGGQEYYNHAVEVLWNDGAGGLLAPAVSELGTHCYRQVAGDFNRDGFPDLATSSSGDVRIGIGNGTGTFTPGASLFIGLPTTLVTGDTDRDGKLDLLVNSSGSVQQWRGNGDGTFSLQQTYAFTIFPRSLREMTRDAVLDAIAYDGSGLSVRTGIPGGALTGTTITIGFPSVGVTAVQPGDWNRDGLIDVAVAGPGGLSVYLRSAVFTFGSEAVLKTGRDYTDVCTGDFNRDGILDLAARESGTALPLNRGIDVFLGTGSGTFGPSTSYGTLDPKGSTVETWDANLDGITDLITSSQVNNSASASADIFLGNGMGEFGLRTSYGLGPVDQDGTNPFMAAADIDRNGTPDIVSGRAWTASPLHTYVQTLLATPPAFTATRQNAQFYPTLFAPNDVAVGDLDRDGKLDVVTATFQANPGIAVHRGSGGGKIGPATTLAQSWNANRVRLADLNRDGILDIVGAYTSAPVRVFTMLGNGNMTFGARTDYSINVGNDFEVGDMNRDGIPDLVVATADSIRLFQGTLIGGYLPLGGVSVGGPIYDIDLADLNRDGVLDVVCAKGNVVVLYSLLNGTLGSPVPLSTPVSISEHVCVSDMNRDGFPDIVVNQSDSYYVVWGASTAPFSTYQHTQLPWGTYDLQVGPMAANGIPYLMIAHNVEWLEIVSVSPSGVLAPAGGYQIGNTPLSMALGDMDRDGLLDVISIGLNTNAVAINLRGTGTITGVETIASSVPRSARLHQNFPNPFNPSTTIRFALPAKGHARLTVHDVRGRLVAVLANRELPEGEHSVQWRGTDADGRAVASGVYLYRLATEEGTTDSKRMVVLK